MVPVWYASVKTPNFKVERFSFSRRNLSHMEPQTEGINKRRYS
jgi:hypothetical protein